MGVLDWGEYMSHPILRRAGFRGAMLACTAILALCAPARAAEGIETLDQGWSDALRELYYYTPQGSRLMPYAWFVAMERAEDTTPFASPANMMRYGFVAPLRPSKLNPDNLPVGFVADPVDQPGTGKWVGLSCAACHTNDVTHKGRTIRIEGAPSLNDFDHFVRDLSHALAASAPNPLSAIDKEAPQNPKFLRLAAKVLGPQAKPEDFTAFGNLYVATTSGILGDLANRTPALSGGYGRVDALTEIINSLSVADLKAPDNLRNPTAPVSYPHLWLAPKLDWVQWNPVAANPIARNTGEVMGVFGHADLTGNEKRYSSTALVDQLVDMEDWLRELMPPVWKQELFGSIDGKLAAKGKELFDKDCRTCHTMPPFELTPPEQSIAGKQFIKITPVDFRVVGTDPRYTLALLGRMVRTGALAPDYNNQPVAPAASFFLGTVGKVVSTAMTEAKWTPQQILAAGDYRFYPLKPGQTQPDGWSPPTVTGLKAGPLFGTWATGPFLHNGSVPNVYELLSPPEKRSKVFWVGSRELDTRKLGFKATEKDLPAAQRAALFRFDTSLPGNSNAGHAYPGRGYAEAEKMAVIEYLKSANLDPKDLPK